MRVFTKIFTTLSALAVALLSSFSASAVSANNFYFEDATFDYYLESSDAGTTLHVKEVLTAVFPETDQNHGITRAIPFSNVGGQNITVENSDALNLTVLRNGLPEPVSKIEKDEDEYIIYIGSADTYVRGEQVYILEYDFKNVITEASVSGANVTGKQSSSVAYQELYWDTNGTGWTQKFNHLTANLHLTPEQSKALLGQTACYVGLYGFSGQSRCAITSDDETTYSQTSANSVNAIDTGAISAETILTFEASNLASGENLTFAVDFAPGTFDVPPLPKNYSYVILTIIVTAFCALIIGLFIRHYLKKAHLKIKYYRSLFAAPQYQPLKDVSVAEAALLTFKRTENSYVATLLELAVSGKINIIKGEPTKILKKNTWQIKLHNITNLTESQKDLLTILNGGRDLKNAKDGIINVKKHAATASLAALSRSYISDSLISLEKADYLDGAKTSRGSSTSSTGLANNFIKILAIGFIIVVSVQILGAFVALASSATFLSWLNLDFTYGVVVGKDILPTAIIIITTITIVVAIVLSAITRKYKHYTEKGLDAANYYDGLYLYIKMAEADRLKFLQSVKGADTSAKGIVKLYEKLLPYACLFGLEESWLKEFNKYCQEINYSVDWYDNNNDFLTFYAISSITRDINSSVAASTSYSSNSGYSGSSSGSSSVSFGGGGGGFSGGGGGGGGGGGW